MEPQQEKAKPVSPLRREWGHSQNWCLKQDIVHFCGRSRYHCRHEHPDEDSDEPRTPCALDRRG